MKFNEFKPQLTEEQVAEDMLRNFLEGKVSKEEMVNYINENQLDEAWWDKVSKLGDIGKKLYDKGKDLYKGFNRGVRGRPAAGGKGGGSIPKTPAANAGFTTGSGLNAAGVPLAVGAGAGAAAVSALNTKPNAARAGGGQGETPVQSGGAAGEFGGTTTTTPVQSGGAAGEFGGTPTTAPTTAPTPAPRQKVKATAANTRDYDKTLALQKKLIAQGANIKADGLMGPNTRAAMKAFKNTNPATGGMGPGGAGGVAKPKPKAAGTGMKSTTTLGSKVKTPGPSVTQNPAYNQTGMDDNAGGVAKPKPKLQPKAFGLDFMPRVDDPKGGETVKTPFGFSYKTLPKDDDLSDRN